MFALSQLPAKSNWTLLPVKGEKRAVQIRMSDTLMPFLATADFAKAIGGTVTAAAGGWAFGVGGKSTTLSYESRTLAGDRSHGWIPLEAVNQLPGIAAVFDSKKKTLNMLPVKSATLTQLAKNRNPSTSVAYDVDAVYEGWHAKNPPGSQNTALFTRSDRSVGDGAASFVVLAQPFPITLPSDEGEKVRLRVRLMKHSSGALYLQVLSVLKNQKPKSGKQS